MRFELENFTPDYFLRQYFFAKRTKGKGEQRESQQHNFEKSPCKFNLSLLVLVANNPYMEINTLTGIIVDSCIKIHSHVGPGCFEHVYEELLYYELTKQHIKVHRQLFLPIQYEGLHIENAYKLDLLVDNKLILELKSVSPLPSVYFKQLKTQLGLLNLKHGMLLNFKVDLMKEGIHRVFNNFGQEDS